MPVQVSVHAKEKFLVASAEFPHAAKEMTILIGLFKQCSFF